MDRVAPWPLLLGWAALMLLGACGEPTTRTGGGSVPPAEAVPEDPEDALAWVRETGQDPTALRARLEAWPLDREAFRSAPATQVALTWRLQAALQDEAVERAEADLARLAERFGGRGRTPQGRALSARAMRLGLFESALGAARRRAEGVDGSPEAARGALDVAGRMLRPEDAEDRARLEATARWVGATTPADILRALDPDLRLPPRDGPRVVVLAGDFALGEVPFVSVLGRWQRDGASAGLRVEVIPLRCGQVRLGLRLVPAASGAEELASIAERLAAEGLTPCDVATGGVDAARLAELGLSSQDVAILVVDARERIVARLSGRNPEARTLDLVVERLISR